MFQLRRIHQILSFSLSYLRSLSIHQSPSTALSTAMSTQSSVVLISGGNAGLGLATLKSLLLDDKKSYSVYMGSRSIERANEAIKAFEADPAMSHALTAGSSKVIPLQLDVEDDASIKAAHDKIAGEAGRLDVLINNAGGAYYLGNDGH